MSELEVDGRSLFLHLYSLDRIHEAAVNLGVRPVLERAGLTTPSVVQKSWVYIRRQPLFAFVEERYPGKGIRKMPSSAATAYQLGAALATWHRLDPDSFSLGSLIRRRGYDSYRRDLQRDPLPDVTRTDDQRDVVDHAVSLMDPRNLSIEPVFSHGDINPNNIMGIEGREIAWIDLDTVCVGSRHHDLAATLVKILFYQDASVFDAFFGGYFADDPESEDSWQREGLNWFVLVCAIEAVKWQSFTRSARPGSRRSSEEDRREQVREQLRWADTFFMMAREAIQAPRRPGASISEAIARITAEVSARSMGRV